MKVVDGQGRIRVVAFATILAAMFLVQHRGSQDGRHGGRAGIVDNGVTLVDSWDDYAWLRENIKRKAC